MRSLLALIAPPRFFLFTAGRQEIMRGKENKKMNQHSSPLDNAFKRSPSRRWGRRRWRRRIAVDTIDTGGRLDLDARKEVAEE